MNIISKSAFLALAFVLFSCELEAQTTTRGPYLQMQTENSITVKWRTNVTTDARVWYGTSPDNLANSASDPATGTDHAVTLTNLASAQKYWYAVGDSGSMRIGDASYHFYTAPQPGVAADTRIWVIGDSGTANADARAVRDAYKSWAGSDPADFWIMLGDNAYNNGTDAEYQSAVFNTYPEILRQLPLWATLGNHDGYSANSSTQTGPYYDIFSFPTAAEAGGTASGTEAYYSFDYANIHFICLDSHGTNRSADGSMLQWMEADLVANTQPWVIAFWHHPPYSKGSHDSDTETQLIDMRQNALPILESWGVDLVLSGHSHSYERSYLLDGHYGVSTSIDPQANILDAGDGNTAGDGAYEKPGIIAAQNEGAVYAVAGSSGKISGGPLNHLAMTVSLNVLGSLVLDVSGNRMDVVFLNDSGTIDDQFTIVKTPDVEPPLVTGAFAEDASHVRINFNEPLDSTQAVLPANYSIAGLGINAAELLPGERSVRLTTSAMTPGSSYTLVVNNVQDLVLNTILPGSSVNFDFFATMTLAFQDGLAPDTSYNGTSDAYIREASAATTHGLETSLQVDGDEPQNTSNDMNILLRWDTSVIPADATVESASIRLNVTNISSGTYTCYEVLRAWNQAEVTWNQAGSGASWGTPGAESGTDRGSAPVCTVSAGATGPLSIALNPAGLAMVQSWVNNPAANHGLIISDPATSDGADFDSSESATATARPKLEITYRVPTEPGNVNPAADFTFECSGLECSFTDASSDSDGLVASWSWDFGDGGTSAQQNPVHAYATPGDYDVTLTVTDDDGATDGFTDLVPVTEPAAYTDQYAQADLPSAGTVNGNFSATHGDDGVAQSITERESGGRKNTRYSYLSHTWQFSVAPGSPVTLYANAWSGGSSDEDAFVFAWSTDNSNFTELFTVSESSPATTRSALISGSGTVFIRVTDTDQTQGHLGQDTVFVDQLYIRSDNTVPAVAPGTPKNLQAVGISSTSIRLNWQPAGTNEQSFDLQRAPVGTSGWTNLPSQGAGSTSFTDTGLGPSTSYDYRIRAGNSAGFSGWSLPVTGMTTGAQQISLSASGYKIKGKQFIDLAWSGTSGAVDIFRNNLILTTVLSGTSYTDDTGNKGGATYIYRVCAAGTSSCSGNVTVVF